jgi:FkbM family methyltransferase
MIENFTKYIDDKNKNYIIFDIGARDCLQSIEFYNNFPNAKIYSFECNPNTLEICRKNIENYQNRITLIEGAVCDYDGEISFYPINQKETLTSWQDGNPGASSLYKNNGSYSIEKYVQYEIKTNCHRLDTIMKKYNIPRVDFIWMDLQGAELLALKSLGDYLKDISYVYTEVSYKAIYTGQVMFNELNNFLVSNNFILKNKLSFTGWQEDALYQNNRFDIVIPIGPNDIELISQQIEYTKKNIIGYRNIYLISYDDSLKIDGCITISENMFDFTLETVAKILGKSDRNGWYLQQLLKLYAGLTIPNILEKYLVIDSDTFFLKPTTFIKDDKCLYNYGSEFHLPYFIHMNQLNNSFNKMFGDKSGICHHMMFETKYIKEIFSIVENTHLDLFYNIFLKKVTELTGSGASEYELYFNYICNKHLDNIIIRKLNWQNTNTLALDDMNNQYDYVSYHWYSRI